LRRQQTRGRTPSAKPRRPRGDSGSKQRRRRGQREAAKAMGLGLAGIVLSSFGCDLDPDALFVRNSPKVDDAIGALDAGDARRAVELLTEYLATGKCEGGAIGAPSSVIEKPHAGFDLGLGLFKLGEQFGKRFGEHEPAPEAGPSPQDEANLANRSEQVECALR